MSASDPLANLDAAGGVLNILSLGLWCLRRATYLADYFLVKGGHTRRARLLDHAKLESPVRYLGIEVDDALEISERTEI